MKIWKLLIPLLMSANLAFGMPILTANQTLEVEKRGDFNLVNLYIEKFKGGNLKKNEDSFFSENKSFINCRIQNGILKNNNLTNIQKFNLINYYEKNLNSIEFKVPKEIYNSTYLKGAWIGNCEIIDLDTYFHELIDANIYWIKIFIANIEFKSIWDKNLINYDLNNNEKNVVVNNIKNLSFKLLKRVKKSYKKIAQLSSNNK